MTDPLPSLKDVARIPSVAVFLFATFVLEVGISAQFTALGKRVFDLSHDELHLGLIGLAEFLPVALLVLLTGAVADRFDRRRVASVALLVEAGFILLLMFEVQREDATIGPIFGLVVGYAVARAFLSPAIRAIPATIVAPEMLPRISPLYSGAFQAGLITGPVASGFLYSVDVWVPFALSAACLAAGAFLLPLVRLHPSSVRTDAPPAPAGRLREAMQGLKVIRGEPLLLGAISLDLFAVLFGGAIALLPAVADERLGVGSVGFGWLRAAAGIGAATTTVVLAFRPVQRRVGTTLFTVVGIFGVATIVFGVTHSYAVAFVALFVLSAADSVSVFIRSTLVPLVTPNEVRGRVGAVENVFIGASNELGAFESGVAGRAFGAGPAIVLGGAATLGIVVVWPLLFPAIRKLDRFPFHHALRSDEPGPAMLPGSTTSPAADS